MPLSGSFGRTYRQALPLTALILFLLHAVLLQTAKHSPSLPLLSNILQLVLGIVIFAAAWSQAARSTGFGKAFWRLQATGFLIWIAAQGTATVYDNILRRPINQPWPSDVLFFIWMTPALFSLFLEAEKEEEGGHRWEQWLDFAQVAILVASAYLFVFAVPAHWRRQGMSIAELELIVEFCRNALIITTFTLCAWSSPSKYKRFLFGRMALFFLLYGAAECPYLFLQALLQLRTGTFWDLPWSLAFVAGIFLISNTVEAGDAAEGGEPVWQKGSTSRAKILLKVVPLIFPLVVLLMAAHVAEEQFALAAGAALASFACSSARILLGEHYQRKAAKTLEEKNALIRSIFEGATDGIYLTDLEGRYVIVNQAFANLVSKPKEQIIGNTAYELVDEKAARRFTEANRAVLESGQTQSFENEIIVERRTHTTLSNQSVHRDAEGKITGIISMVRDITEYRAMQDRLRQSQKMEAIGTLAGGVAHDFNNLLMVISGYSSVLSDTLAANPKQRGHVEQIQRASERAASLTRQLLAFSRKQTIQPMPLHLNEVVGGIEKLLRRLIGEHIAITTVLAPDLGTVRADAGQIEQVILNLAVNARDAMPAGGKLLLETRNVEIVTENFSGMGEVKPGRYVELMVTDNGMGMQSTVQDRIFEPFFTTKPTGKGTGLGLSTAHNIVQEANGHITFSSQPGEGTTFRIYLPRIEATEPGRIAVEAENSHFDGEETVLLVEDDKAVCDLVRAVLMSRGYSVLAAGHPQEAEKLCQSQAGKVDLLLTDVIMPEMSGAELSKRLTQQNPGMKVIFMSGYIDDSMVRQGIREREMAFLQKPFSPISLAKKVREVLDAAPVC